MGFESPGAYHCLSITPRIRSRKVQPTIQPTDSLHRLIDFDAKRLKIEPLGRRHLVLVLLCAPIHRRFDPLIMRRKKVLSVDFCLLTTAPLSGNNRRKRTLSNTQNLPPNNFKHFASSLTKSCPSGTTLSHPICEIVFASTLAQTTLAAENLRHDT